MAITKTNFINFSRCPRYVVLDKIKREKLGANITYKEYLEEKEKDKIEEISYQIKESILSDMYGEDENGEEIDLIDVENEQLKILLPYYNLVEQVASDIALKQFGGKIISAENTKDQKRFEFDRDGIKYLCYLDIYNEIDDNVNIIEVKASTSKKYMDLTYTQAKIKETIFESIDNILYLKDELYNDLPDGHFKQRQKLFDKLGIGKYVFDLAIQRYIIENSGIDIKPNYYLAVLNHNYIFDGIYDEDNNPIYDTDENGNELITFIDLTKVTKEYQDMIELEARRIEKYTKEMDASPCRLGKFCEKNKPSGCKFFGKICGKEIPKKNSVLNYMNNGHGFKTEDGERIKGLDLINEGYLHMLDIPEGWIINENHRIQRNCLKNNEEYVDKNKIELGLAQLEYPIYHLDFETFPCPVPRFRGEKAYTQSPFEFSLHIEREPGVCDFDKDNYVFLASSFNDEREELVKKMLEYMDPNKGTLFAQNTNFEQARIKELAIIFPEYSTDLMKLHKTGFDLIWLVRTRSKLYQDLGLSESEAKKVNYYHKDLSGSYSIKKTLPVFSNLKYDDLDVKNGTQAIVEYANYPYKSSEDIIKTYNGLIEYCKQDTWAMVLILDALRKLIKKHQ